ncbi:MAG: amino acid ABC transporter substrate-binding protein [Clostridia bacterium]|nr:amino acid ABC transporter substrate-binding protein [Clostridia bacterium]
MKQHLNQLKKWLQGPIGMMLCFAVLAIAAFFVIRNTQNSSTESSLPAINKNHAIVIGVQSDMAPFCKENSSGDPVGFEAELAKAVGEQILGGPGVQYLFVTPKSARAHLTNGDCHVLIACMSVNETNKKNCLLSRPYAEENMYLLTCDARPIDHTSMSAKIGVIRGSDATEPVKNMLVQIGSAASVVEIGSYPEAQEALLSGRLSAFCAPYSVLAKLDGNGLSITGHSIGTVQYAAAVLSHDETLIKAVDSALETLRKNGTLNTLYQKYGVTTPLEK